MIHVGAAGIKNLKKPYQGQKACVQNKKKKDMNVNNWICEACDAENMSRRKETVLR